LFVVDVLFGRGWLPRSERPGIVFTTSVAQAAGRCRGKTLLPGPMKFPKPALLPTWKASMSGRKEVGDGCPAVAALSLESSRLGSVRMDTMADLKLAPVRAGLAGLERRPVDRPG